jgi:hypothetical protein
MPAIRTIFKALLYLFAAIGFVDVCGRLLLLPLTGQIYGYRIRLPWDVEIVSVVPSADRSLKAILYRWTGSGFNPGCGEFVSVLEGSASDTTGWGASNRVFANTTCDNSLNMTWEPPAGGRIKPRLRIDADPAKATLMSRHALRGTVAIAYRNDP